MKKIFLILLLLFSTPLLATNEIRFAYDSAGDPNLYVILGRTTDVNVWDVDNTAWAISVEADEPNYALDMSKIRKDFYWVNFPTDISTAGIYPLAVYKRASTDPNITDDLIVGDGQLFWDGFTAVTDTRDANDIWYVSKTGSNDNDGHSWATAYLDINSTIAAASKGDKIYIGKGDFPERIILTDANKEGLSLIGNSRWTTNINPDDGNDVFYCTIDGVTVQSLNFHPQQGGLQQQGIHFLQCTGGRVIDCNAWGLYDGIYANQCVDFYIENSQGVSGYDGIMITSCTNPIIRNIKGKTTVNFTDPAGGNGVGIAYSIGVDADGIQGWAEKVDTNSSSMNGVIIGAVQGVFRNVTGRAYAGYNGNQWANGVSINLDSQLIVENVVGTALVADGNERGIYIESSASGLEYIGSFTTLVLNNAVASAQIWTDVPVTSQYDLDINDVDCKVVGENIVLTNGTFTGLGTITIGGENWSTAVQTAGEAAIVAQDVPTQAQMDANDAAILAAIAAAKTAADANFTNTNNLIEDVNTNIIDAIADQNDITVAEIFAKTGITAGGTWTFGEIVKYSTAWLIGKWTDEEGDGTYEISDAEDPNTTVLEYTSSATSPQKEVTLP